jgi:ribonuclease PH
MAGKEKVELSNHRVVMHLHKGGLHRALGISEDKDIPEERLDTALNSKNEHVRKMASLAKTMKSWKK